MPFFHAFTGCDIVSAFRGKRKKAALQTCNVYPEASRVFGKLSTYPPEIEKEDTNIFEKFVMAMYDRLSSASRELRLDMFARKQKPFDAIPLLKVH